ncbi:MAG TPA: Rrf2 family transcriptional regulator [Lacipirellulaceae bacterium]|nr:Rrf2 family transcriptional regulator [Lacipirellulaceae bacterium]
MFSQTVEYALRAMVQLSAEAPEASTTQIIAESTQVPAAYLAKVLQSLRRAGLITSRRGVGGGVRLARPPKKINLLEVINAVEPLERSKDAPKRGAGVALAPLNRKLDAILGDLQKSCAAVSLADVAPRPKAKARR